MTLNFISRVDDFAVVLAGQAPKKTKTTAAITMVAQKTPIPAITTIWCLVLSVGEHQV